MECPLLLTTLSGVTFKVSLSVAKFDRFTDLEDQVMDYLASVTDLQVFGCVIDFLHTTTQTYLEDPIWDKLQQGREYTIVFRDCSVTLLEQEQLGGYPIDQVPLAVHVPMNSEETVPEWVFAGVPRLRHVSVESGIRLIGAEAWQDCRQLRIVKLPATVVGIADNVFRDCKLLNSVLAPGCRDFGYKAFSECCSLQSVYASGGAVNVFSGETTGEALRGDTGFASVFGPQNEGHKFTRKCNLTLDTSMAKPTPKPLLRMVEREEYSECLGASVERPV